MATTYSIIHHQSGGEYIAEFEAGDVIRAAYLTSWRDKAELVNQAAAQDWLDNQDVYVVVRKATWLCAEIETGRAWIARELS